VFAYSLPFARGLSIRELRKKQNAAHDDGPDCRCDREHGGLDLMMALMAFND
jgi:hypothetical protein